MELYSKKRISVIIEKAYKDKVVMLLEECGASGYTVYKSISGKGHHGVKEDYAGIGDFYSNIEIVSITSPDVAERVLCGLHRVIDKGIEFIVYVVDVSVIRNEHFN